MYGFRGVGLSEVQLSISELSVVGGWWVVGGGAQTHFMVGPGRGPTKKIIFLFFSYADMLSIVEDAKRSRSQVEFKL